MDPERTAADMPTASRLIAPGTAGLAWGAAAASITGGGLVLAGAIAEGAAGALGAAVGTVLVIALITVGVASVMLVARVMPGALLGVALLMYLTQVIAAIAVVVGIHRSGMLDDGTLAPRWIAAAVIAATLAWCAGQIVGVGRLRRPLYDLPEASAR